MVEFNGKVLVGGLHRQGDPDGVYHSLDGTVTMTKQGADLVVTGSGPLTIKNFNFETGALGIHLAEAPNTATPAVPTIEFGANGFPTEVKTPPEEFGAWVTQDFGAVNYIVRGRQGIYLFQSDLGDDQLIAGEGDDRDALFGHEGSDVFDEEQGAAELVLT